ncbi:MAG: hypothetical protein ACXVDW_11845 [Bacteroidia bacterium]
MLKAKIVFSEVKRKVLVFGSLNCIAYIIFFLMLKYFNLMHFSGLRMFNYVILFLFSLYEIKNWVKQLKAYIPSIQAFGIIFLTGGFSFVLLAGFIFLYSLFDPYITELYFNTYGKLSSSYSVLILLEGLAGRIIVALVAMLYSDMYKDGEKEIN